VFAAATARAWTNWNLKMSDTSATAAPCDCRICLHETEAGDSNGTANLLVACGCACKGTAGGPVHVGCAVKAAQANEKAWTQCCVCQQQWGSELLVCLARECHKLCEEHTAPDDTHDGGARAAVHFDPDRGDAHHGRFGTDQAAR
jgi:hypothetical protein